MSKIDLTLVTKLVRELATQNEIVEAVDAATSENKSDYTVEVAKAMGLATALKMEAELLAADYARLITLSTVKVGSSDALADFYNLVTPALKNPKTQS